MNFEYCIIILICWFVFSLVVMIGDKTHTIIVDPDWLFIILTAPITVPAIILIFPVAVTMRIVNKIKRKRIQKLLHKNKK